MRSLQWMLMTCGLAMGEDQCQSISVDERVDCLQMYQDSCESAGCCWGPVERPSGANPPWCFYKDRKMLNCTLGADPKRPFSDAELDQVMKLFELNLDVQGTGQVVASPDHNTGPGGDYYFAWARDGALSMNAYLQTKPFPQSDEKMEKWIQSLEKAQHESDPNGINVLVEPKFLIPEGTPFTGAWCRPQNDAPGLRAITAMSYAAKKPSVNERVWSLVKQNLDWVVANYSSSTCDLWEEVRSEDFFWNRYSMRKALLMGSDFAKTVGKDQGRAHQYQQAAQAVTQMLSQHVINDYVIESNNRQKDTAVIEAFNVGDMEDGLFAPLSKEAVTTLAGLSQLYCRSFAINQQAAQSGVPGVLFGRYEGDSYDGGNPWVLLTASAATLLYRQALQATKMPPTGEVAQILGNLLGRTPSAQNLLGAGDAVMLLMKKYLVNGMHMNEQIDRNTGKMTSAQDLTWNYANVLKAMKARAAAAAAAVENSVQI